jgi:Zn/Cd-binding protein ZinT
MRTWAEIDPRLAEIKREYSRAHPGAVVDTPDEAQNAWNWFLQEGHKTHPNPVLYNHDIPTWQKMPANPEELHKQLMQRMPQVVQNQQQQQYKNAQTTDDILDRIANARAQTATEVSEGNAAAGNYRKGRFNYHGLRISIENPKGSIRSGVSASGTKWSNEMKSDYGYIRGTIGADGDPVDVFIGDDPKSEMVYIINQVNKSGSFDEHKVVLGALDAKQAKQTYLSNYKDGWTGCGSVIGMTMQQFKAWLQGDVTKPAESIKQAADLGIPELPQPKRTRVVMPYDDGYLLERMNNPKYPANLGRQRFPGGGIDVGETSQQAAAREMMEELGLSVKPEQLRSLGIHANADHGPEEYFELADHGIQPGNYTASIGGDKHIELIKGLLNSPHYWGAQLNTLQQPNPTTGAVKQAGNPLAAFGKVLKRTATTASRVPVPKVVRNAVLPTVKPNPALVAANSAAKTAPPVVARPAAAARTVARPQPAAARGMRAPVRNVATAPVPHPTVAAVTGKLRGVRDTVANVPKGEAFSQRPIANTSRLATLDGVPGMRLVNRAALVAAGYTAGSHLLDANNAVNGAIDTSATQLGDYFDATPEQRAGFSGDLYNAKWNVLQDQTLGAAGRGVKSLLGGKRDDRVASQDAAMRAVAMEAVRRAVHAPEDGVAKPSLLRRVLANRSPVAVAADSAPTLMQQLVDKPSTLTTAGRVVDNIRRSGVDVNNPTAVEQALRDNFGSMYSRLTPQQLNKLRRDIATGTAVGDTVLRYRRIGWKDAYR